MKIFFISIVFSLVTLFATAQASDHEIAGELLAGIPEQSLEKPEANPVSNIRYITDNDGNSYDVVKIGDKLWMAENLKTTKFNDGTRIPLVSDYNTWSSLASPGYCWYNNDEKNYRTDYGALYNGFTVSTGKLCPTGWHVPSADEWTFLAKLIGEKTAGGKLKETGSQYWMNPNTGATNETGFTALPGGSRGSYGSFLDEGLRGYWWSSTESDNTKAWTTAMGYSYSNISGFSDNKKSGLSVRCVMD